MPMLRCLFTHRKLTVVTNFPLLLFLFLLRWDENKLLYVCVAVRAAKSSQRVYSLSCQLQRIGVGEQSLGEFKNPALRQIAAFQLLSYMKLHIHQSAFKDFFRLFFFNFEKQQIVKLIAAGA